MKIYVLLLWLMPDVLFTAGAQAPVGLEGQIICCEECWKKEDRASVPYGTPADLARASACVANGDPTLLAATDAKGKTAFYRLETGKFKPPGKNWLELIGSRVEIAGATRSRSGANYLRVDELKVLATPDQIAPGPDVIGTEPELILKDVFGSEQNLRSLRGRIVILNFWATYCGPCREEMPGLAAVQNEYGALGVQAIGASADTLADQDAVLKYIKAVKVNFPVWLGATIPDMAKFGLGPALPGMAVVGRDGRIVAVFRGVVHKAELSGVVDKLLSRSRRESRPLVAEGRKSAEASTVPS